ncbi:hypothetical protein GOP47_0000979 [Adiantum capillus-veneris]|uniref:Uncharacterized protein n=1 Tax=Adiantum capillus-veneris TaxID=13818 RepID=A0A9D4VE03_ADICA|nr:hypothetical protein GOP47_0000979 [Adiantum capillus-veneris]
MAEEDLLLKSYLKEEEERLTKERMERMEGSAAYEPLVIEQQPPYPPPQPEEPHISEAQPTQATQTEPEIAKYEAQKKRQDLTQLSGEIAARKVSVSVTRTHILSQQYAGLEGEGDPEVQSAAIIVNLKDDEAAPPPKEETVKLAMPEKQKKFESLAHTPIAESSKAREDTTAVPLILHTPPAVVPPPMQTFGQGLGFFASQITMMTKGMKHQARQLEQETATKSLQLEKALQEVANHH